MWAWQPHTKSGAGRGSASAAPRSDIKGAIPVSGCVSVIRWEQANLVGDGTAAGLQSCSRVLIRSRAELLIFNSTVFLNRGCQPSGRTAFYHVGLPRLWAAVPAPGHDVPVTSRQRDACPPPPAMESTSSSLTGSCPVPEENTNVIFGPRMPLSCQESDLSSSPEILIRPPRGLVQKPPK